MLEAEAMVSVTCVCGHVMKVPASAMGKVCKCVKCAERVSITPQNTRPVGGAAAVPAPSLSPSPRPAAQAPAAAPMPAPSVSTVPKGPSSFSDKVVLEAFVHEGLIGAEKAAQVEEIQAVQGGKCYNILIENGTVTKEDIHAFLSKHFGLAGINLRQYEVPREVLALADPEFCLEHMVLPLDKLGRLLTVGMACPLDTAIIKELERQTGLRVKPMLCRYDDLKTTIEKLTMAEKNSARQNDDSLARLNVPAARKEPAKEVKPAEPVSGPEPPVVQEARRPARPRGLNRDDVLDRLRELHQLPCFPKTLEHVHNATMAAPPDLREIAGNVNTDPALAAFVMSLANANAYGLQGNITNANMAVAMLGAMGVYNLAKRLSEVPEPHADSGFSMKEFRSRSLFCAMAAMSLSRSAGRGQANDAYTAGLLHGIGSLALAQLYPKEYGESQRGPGIRERLDAEADAFGLTHAEVGYHLARSLKLPKVLELAIREHHEPARAVSSGDDLALLMVVAVAMTEAFILKGSIAEALSPCKEALARLSLAEEAVVEMHEGMVASLGQPG